MDQNLKTDAVTLTKTLCGHLAAAQFGDLSAAARREARRGVLDWIGCALAGSGASRRSTSCSTCCRRVGGRPQATVLGRGLKLGRLDAPLANGQMGHVLDFDDTHMGGVVLHASSPVLAALFALAERCAASAARDLMLAYAVGFEAGVRCGSHRAGPPQGRLASHWHARHHRGGRGRGKLIGLDGQKLTYAMGIAATQAAGMQQNRGTMCKSFHAGKAAQNGVLAALLAERGFDSTQEIIEGRRGFSPHLQRHRDAGAADRGTRRELADRNQRPQALCLRRGAASADRRGDRDPRPRHDRSRGGRARSSCGSIRWCCRSPT